MSHGTSSSPWLLADSSILCNFAKAGTAHLQAFLDTYGDNLYVTTGVLKELRRLSKAEIPELKETVDGWEQDRIKTLSPELELDVANVLKQRNKYERYIDKDRGETETAFFANAARRNDDFYDVLMDDGWGRGLVSADLEKYDSSEIACYLVLGGRLDEQQGWEVYDQANKYVKRSDYDTLLAEIREEAKS